MASRALLLFETGRDPSFDGKGIGLSDDLHQFLGKRQTFDPSVSSDL